MTILSSERHNIVRRNLKIDGATIMDFAARKCLFCFIMCNSSILIDPLTLFFKVNLLNDDLGYLLSFTQSQYFIANSKLYRMQIDTILSGNFSVRH